MTVKNHALAVDVGGTHVKIGVLHRSGRLLAKTKIDTHAGQGPARVVARVAEAARGCVRDAGLDSGRLRGVGIGSPGPLDPRTGVILHAPNLKGWRNVPFAGMLGKSLGLRARLDNDGNAAAIAEHRYGAGKGSRDMILLTLGTGVGGGIILGGKLLGGVDGTAGELGHFSLDPAGPPCGCGQRGCLEQYASATAIARRATELAKKKRRGLLWKLSQGGTNALTSRHVSEAAKAGDAQALQVWEETAFWLGRAVAGYLNVLNPEVVVLAGGVMAGGGTLLTRVRKHAQAAFPQPARRARIRRAGLGYDAGLIGAGVLGLELGA